MRRAPIPRDWPPNTPTNPAKDPLSFRYEIPRAIRVDPAIQVSATNAIPFEIASLPRTIGRINQDNTHQGVNVVSNG